MGNDTGLQISGLCAGYLTSPGSLGNAGSLGSPGYDVPGLFGQCRLLGVTRLRRPRALWAMQAIWALRVLRALRSLKFFTEWRLHYGAHLIDSICRNGHGEGLDDFYLSFLAWNGYSRLAYFLSRVCIEDEMNSGEGHKEMGSAKMRLIILVKWLPVKTRLGSSG